MKLFITGFLSIVALTLSAAPSLSAQDSDGETRAECLQRCLEQYHENMEACTDSCFVCDTWIIILGCVSGHTDEKCKANCGAEAKRILEACQRECGPTS